MRSLPQPCTLIRIIQMISEGKDVTPLFSECPELTRYGTDRTRFAKCLKTTLGPCLSSVHPVFDDYQTPLAHMHLMLVTSREYSKSAITSLVKDTWAKVRNRSVARPTGLEEVLRSRPQRLDRRKKLTETQKEARLGHFWPGVPKDDTTQAAMRSCKYLCRPLKAAWTAEQICDYHDLVAKAGLTPQHMHRRMGMQGTAVGNLPSSFSYRRLLHEYIAQYNSDSGWDVFRREH